MRKYSLFFAVILQFAIGFTAFAQNKVDPNFHIYLLMGQSNMAGRGPLTETTNIDENANVMMLNKAGVWVIAKNPVHFDKPSVAGVGPGLSFGTDMAKQNPNVKIGLVPCAVGGTAIEAWMPGGFDAATQTHPYDDALIRIKEAMKTGIIKGVIWHQGESNAGTKDFAPYMAKLDSLINNVRTVVGNKKLPFILGELGQFKENFKLFNIQLSKVPDKIRYTAVVSSAELTDKGDGTHFDAASANLLGKRYVAKMIELQRKAN